MNVRKTNVSVSMRVSNTLGCYLTFMLDGLHTSLCRCLWRGLLGLVGVCHTPNGVGCAWQVVVCEVSYLIHALTKLCTYCQYKQCTPKLVGCICIIVWCCSHAAPIHGIHKRHT